VAIGLDGRIFDYFTYGNPTVMQLMIKQNRNLGTFFLRRRDLHKSHAVNDNPKK